MMVDLSQCLQDMQTLIGEIIGNVDKISPSMGKAIGQYGLELFREVSGKCVAHLDWWIKAILPLSQDLRHILPAVVSAGEKQRYFPIIKY